MKLSCIPLCIAAALPAPTQACRVSSEPQAVRERLAHLTNQKKNSQIVVIGRLLLSPNAKTFGTVYTDRVVKGGKLTRYSIPIHPGTCTSIILRQQATFYLNRIGNAFTIVHSEMIR